MKRVVIKGLSLFNVPDEIARQISSDGPIKPLQKNGYGQWIKDVKSGKALMFLADHSGTAYQALAIFSDQKLLTSIAPNLVLSYFDLALEHIQFTDKYRSTLYYSSIKHDEEIHVINERIFNRFIQYRSSGILFLHLTVEAFINYIIPDDFIYEKKENSKNERFIETITKYNKVQIERWLSFKEKIDCVLIQATNNNSIENHKDIREKLIQLVNIRDEIVHLKSAKTKANKQFYQKVFKSLIDEDLSKFIKAAARLIELYKPGFLEFYTQKDKRQNAKINVNGSDNMHVGLLFEIQRQKFEVVEVHIKKDGELQAIKDKINFIVAHLGLMEDMNLINDYHLEEKASIFLLTIYKTSEQAK